MPNYTIHIAANADMEAVAKRLEDIGATGLRKFPHIGVIGVEYPGLKEEIEAMEDVVAVEVSRGLSIHHGVSL